MVAFISLPEVRGGKGGKTDDRLGRKQVEGQREENPGRADRSSRPDEGKEKGEREEHSRRIELFPRLLPRSTGTRKKNKKEEGVVRQTLDEEGEGKGKRRLTETSLILSYDTLLQNQGRREGAVAGT